MARTHGQVSPRANTCVAIHDLMRRGVPCPTNSPHLPHSPSVKNTLRGYSDQVILTHAFGISYHAVTVLPQYTVTQSEDTPVTTTTYPRRATVYRPHLQ
jgi:hypothetical protein